MAARARTMRRSGILPLRRVAPGGNLFATAQSSGRKRGAIPARGISGNRKQLVPLMRQDAASTCRSGILPLRRCVARRRSIRHGPIIRNASGAIPARCISGNRKQLVRLMRQDAASKCRSGILPLRRCGTTRQSIRHGPIIRTQAGAIPARCTSAIESKLVRLMRQDAASTEATAVAAEGELRGAECGRVVICDTGTISRRCQGKIAVQRFMKSVILSSCSSRFENRASEWNQVKKGQARATIEIRCAVLYFDASSPHFRNREADNRDRRALENRDFS